MPTKFGRSATSSMAAMNVSRIICSHDDREDIEDDFLHWHRCSEISYHYKLKDVRALYRHGRAHRKFAEALEDMQRLAQSL